MILISVFCSALVNNWSLTVVPFPSPGGSRADPGEARAAFGRSAEAGGDQRVLVRPREHNQGQGPPAF